jgi:stearoyl-CoA 9-desaturase NADPH oxidoreductase
MFTATLRRGRSAPLFPKLLAALASPHPVDRYVAPFARLWRFEEVLAEVVGVTPETADAVTLTLRPNRNWRGFRAGQHVRLGVEVDGVRRVRCFSLSSSPDRSSGLLDVTVKRRPGGLVSGWIHDRVAPGQIVTLSPAEGDFTLPSPLPPHLVFVTGGSGITPVMSMLRTLLGRRYRGRIDLLHFTRRHADAIFARELRERAAAHDAFRLVFAVTGEPPSAGDLAGHLSEEMLARVAPGWADADAWVCGPTALVDAAGALWERRGRRDRLRVECFFAASRPPAADAIGGTVHFARSGRFVVSDGRPLLEQAEAAGLAPAFGCRRGICRTCVRTKVSGTVQDVVTGALSTDPDEDIRLCASAPIGPVTLDL